MKKIFMLTLALCAAATMMAQYDINVFKNGNRVFNQPVSNTENLKFDNGNAIFNYNNMSWSRAIGEIDSIVFARAVVADTTYGDTTAVDTTGGIRIHWAASGVTVINGLAGQGVDITVDGMDVTVNSTSSESDLVYVLSGECSDGSLAITSSKKLILALDGISLTHTDGPAINMLSDKRVMLHMMKGTNNTFADGSGSHKGAIQFKGKLDIQGSGSMSVSGHAKHGIQSSGRCTMISGHVSASSQSKDAMNVDDFVMDGGILNVTSGGDGIDGDKGLVEINKGAIYVECTSADVKGIGCDSTLTINGGLLQVTCSGNQSKCVKAGQDIQINNGVIVLNARGTLVLEALGSGYDPSYCTGIKGSSDIYINGGNITINCADTNAGGKGISANGSVYLNNGTMNITAEGNMGAYTNEEGTPDSYYSTCVKADNSIFVNGGTYVFNAGGRGISTDSNYVQTGGQITLTTNKNGAVLAGSGTNATDGYTAACVKADYNMTITGGRLTGTSTGKGGRGLVAERLTIGEPGESDDLIDINIYTSGAPVNTTSGGGGWGGGPGGSTSDYWKGLPKGIKIDSSIVINSGRVSVYCSQTSGDPTAEAIESKGTIIINGGEVEANSYDDAINAAQELTINGGKVWAYARGNDGMDCNGSGGVNVNGGLVIVSGTEVGIDADTENGNKFNIRGGIIVSKGGNMGAWDTPTCPGTQRYILASVTPANGFCIKNSNGDEMLVFKAPTVTGSGFIDQTNGTGTKPPGGGGGGSQSNGVGISLPDMVQGTYQVYSNVTITGGTEWHGYYVGATCTTNGNATSVTTR